MTKRLTIMLVALVMFCLVALPVSAMQQNPATGRYNGSVITNTPSLATIFIGESGLNITPALKGTTSIGWWAPGTFSFPNNPSQINDVSTSSSNFEVSQGTYGSYTGTWYCLTGGTTANGAVFMVADPQQSLAVVDVGANQGTGQVMSGQAVVRGTVLTFKLDTNLAAFTSGGRESPVPNATLGAAGFVIVPGGAAPPDLNSVGIAIQGVSPTPTVVVTMDTFWNPGATFTLVTPANPVIVTVDFGDGTAPYTSTITTSYPPASPLTVPHTYATFGDFTISVTITSVANPADTISYTTTNPIHVTYSPINPATDGFMDIKIKDATGKINSRISTNTPAGAGNAPDTITSLTDLFVSKQPYYFGNFTGIGGQNALGWSTGALDPGTGSALYPAGTYTIWSETTLSHIKDNYKLNGGDYSGKSVSTPVTVSLSSDQVSVTASTETVVRSKPFSVTITGKPLTPYVVWVSGTGSMSGGYDDQPPMLGVSQEQVYTDVPNLNNNYPIGAYVYENAGTATVRTDVAKDTVAPLSTTVNRTRYYALVNLSSAGSRTVGFVTSNWTKAQQYTIRVSANNFGQYREDEVSLKVVRGAVTITAAGDQSYYIGEDIKFTGTNTETQTTYLFLTGVNLWSQGSQITNKDPRRSSGNTNSQVINGNANTFLQRAVNADNTWDYTWGTAGYALDAGTYTVYAVSQPNDAQNLGNAEYGTVSIVIKKPFVSATTSQSTVAQGDKMYITGTAEGKPQQGVAIWILGKNFATRQTQSVASDASYNYEVTSAATSGMDAGQYFVIVQHPMQNQQFDVNICNAPADNKVCNLQMGASGMPIFTFSGAGSLQGSDAAEAVTQAINSPNVDDTYTKMVFLIEVPSISLDTIGDKHVGDKFTISGTTNLAVDDDLLVSVLSSSFKPTQKTQSGEFSGASGTVKVVKGSTGLNTFSFEVDASTFKPDEYIVQAERVLSPKVMETMVFNVLEGTAQLTRTPTPTSAVPATTTVKATEVPPTVVAATPTKTPTQPGFGSLTALAGLVAVAFLIVRRH